MQLSEISRNLKQMLEGMNADPLDSPPWKITEFLEACNKTLIKYILHANEQLGSDTEANVSAKELDKINRVFRELTDNFFPMAHSNEPLSRLQIVEKERLRRVLHYSERLIEVSERLIDVGKHAEDVSREIRTLV